MSFLEAEARPFPTRGECSLSPLSPDGLARGGDGGGGRGVVCVKQ